MPFIRQYAELDKTAWDAYVMQHPDSTVFHLTAWKEVIEQTFGHKSIYLLAFRNERTTVHPEPSALRRSSHIQQTTFAPPAQLNAKPIYPESNSLKKTSEADLTGATNSKNSLTPAKPVGLLPLFRIKSLYFGNYLTSLPFVELGGIVADDELIAEQLLDHAVKLAEDLRCDYIELRNRKVLFDLPVKSIYYNFRREIFSEEDQNLKAIPRKARRMVRQGKKKGLKSEIGNHLLTEFYEIFAKSYHRLGTPVFPLKLFKNLLKTLDNKVQILLIRSQDKIPIASVMTFFFRGQVVPYYAGSVFEYRNLAPNDFMYWELMRFGCENGYKIFDFGRSKKDTGSYHFKRHWGFKPVQLAYQYHMVKSKELPNLSPSNPKYQKKIELWKKLPLPVTKILGPPIAKYLT
jgi:FemAB-related protein (PEP-CTERM system-associated)